MLLVTDFFASKTWNVELRSVLKGMFVFRIFLQSIKQKKIKIHTFITENQSFSKKCLSITKIKWLPLRIDIFNKLNSSWKKSF